MVFPEELNFICRNCGFGLMISKEMFGKIHRGIVLICPGCEKGPTERPPHFHRFIEFYRRLVETDERTLGFALVGYEIIEGKMIIPHLDKGKFECLACHHTFKLSFGRIIKMAKEPAIFRCPKCKAVPKRFRAAKEFLVSLRWVLGLAHKTSGAEVFFDWWTPLGISSEPFQRHLRSRRKEDCRKGPVPPPEERKEYEVRPSFLNSSGEPVPPGPDPSTPDE